MPFKKNDESKAKPQPVMAVEKKTRYRYFCDACTGNAFEMNEGDAYPRNVICKACGRPVGVIKKENFIALK